MKTFTLRSQFYFPPANPPFLIHTRTKSNLKSPSPFPLKTTIPLNQIVKYPTKTNYKPMSKKSPREEFPQISPTGYSRFVILGTVSVGFALFLMGIDEHKALALGPGGPLMEDFWENMRRYGLYALTVSSGVIYTIFQPLAELLKNPISAILILTIFGGGIYIVSQVVSAMVGVSDFAYDYSY